MAHVEDISHLFKKSIGLWLENAGNWDAVENEHYRRNAFNYYGDIDLPKPDSKVIFSQGDVSVSDVSDDVAERLNRLNKYLTERGATMVIAGYPIGKGEYTPKIEEYLNFQEKLEQKLDAPVISNFTDYMFDYNYFFDTKFHLTDEGTELRTQQLIEDLKVYFEQQE